MGKKVTLQTEIGQVITSMADSFDKELFSKTKEEIAAEWYFDYDSSLTPEQNLYQFTSMLDLHRRRTRRWEEHHNGSCCVVERVRDEYLMPRIREFLEAQSK